MGSIGEIRVYVPCNCCTSNTGKTETPKAPEKQPPHRDEFRPGKNSITYTECSFTASYSYKSISSSGAENFSAKVSIQSREATVQVSDQSIGWLKQRLVDAKMGRNTAAANPMMGYSLTREGQSFMLSFEASGSFLSEVMEWIDSCTSLLGGDLSRAFGEFGSKWAARMYDDSPDVLRSWLSRRMAQNREIEASMKKLRPEQHRPEHGRRPEHGHRPERPGHSQEMSGMCCPIRKPANYKKPDNLPVNQLAQRQEEMLKQAVELLNRGICRCNTGEKSGGCDVQQPGYTKRFSSIAFSLSGEMGEDDIIRKSNEVNASRRNVYNEWYNSTEDHDSAESLSRLDEAHIDWVTNLRDTDPAGFRVWLEMNVKPHVWGYDMDNLIVPEDFTLEDYNTWMTQSVREYMNAAEESVVKA